MNMFIICECWHPCLRLSAFCDQVGNMGPHSTDNYHTLIWITTTSVVVILFFIEYLQTWLSLFTATVS